MRDDAREQNDLWIKQSLGDVSNWEGLDEAGRNSLRKTAALHTLLSIILVLCVALLSVTILQHGAKATLVTSSLAIIGAVFPAIGKVVSGSIEYFESINQKLRAAKLKLMCSYFNLYALLLVGTAFLDFIAAALLGLWE